MGSSHLEEGHTLTPEERQLERIVKSEVFAGGGRFKPSERLASLLEFIVTETLRKRQVTDTSILLDFYKLSVADADEKNATARINIGRLRDKLDVYYALLGADDPIIISIPRNRYRVEFLSNLKSPAQKEVRRGLYYVHRESPKHIRQALIHFENAIQMAPDFSEGYAGKANALLTMTLHALSEDQEGRFHKAEQAARKAIALDPRSWRGHASMGAIYMLRHQWSRADEAFDIARNISPMEIDSIDSYGPYLLARGRYDEALSVATRYQNEGPDDVVLLRRAAIYLYALRHFPEAEVLLHETLQMEEYSWLSHIFLVFVSLALKQPDQALSHVLDVEKYSGASLWPGLKIMCLQEAGKFAEAESELTRLAIAAERSYVPPMQHALAAMATGNAVDAIAYLSEACDEGEPFTVGLHLWQFVDVLRRYPEFQALLRKRGFPAA